MSKYYESFCLRAGPSSPRERSNDDTRTEGRQIRPMHLDYSAMAGRRRDLYEKPNSFGPVQGNADLGSVR